MNIKKTIITICFILLVSILGGCSVVQKFIPVTAPPYDASDVCNNEVQEISRLSQVKNPIDAMLVNVEKVTWESLQNLDFDDFIQRVSTSYFKQVAANGGFRALLTDINKDANNQQQLKFAVTNLRQCRTNQTRSIARRISNPNNRAAIQEKKILDEKVKRDREFIKDANEKFGKRISVYEETSKEMGGTNTISDIRYINIGSLNVRDRPTTNGSQVIGSMLRNATINVIQDQGSWLKIDYQGRVAYIAKKYTSTSTSSTNNPAGVGQAIHSAKNTQKEIDKDNAQIQIEMDAIWESHGIPT